MTCDSFLKGPDINVPSQPINVNEAIIKAISGITEEKNQIQMIQKFDHHLPNAFLDEQILGEIIEELATNACKAMKNRGILIASTAIVSQEEKTRHDLNLGSEFIKIEVSDTGCGIAPNKKDWIFEPFHTMYADGSGLGLTFVKDSIKRMRGIIYEAGVFGKGARFVMLLPVNVP